MVDFNLGLPYKIGRLSDKLVHQLRTLGVLKSGGRILIPLEPRINNKFVAHGLSRMDLRSVGMFEKPAIPKFDAEGFEKNLEDILNTVKDHRELTDRIADALGTFIWRPDWTSLVLFHPVTGEQVLIPGRQFPSFDKKDIELARPNSIIDHAVKNRHLVYVPDYRFQWRDYFYCIPVPEGLEEGKSIATNTTRENINITPYIRAFEASEDRKQNSPVTVVVSPILWMPEKKVLGYFTAAYTEGCLFGSPEPEYPGTLKQTYLPFFHSISQAAALKLLEFQKLGKNPQ